MPVDNFYCMYSWWIQSCQYSSVTVQFKLHHIENLNVSAVQLNEFLIGPSVLNTLYKSTYLYIEWKNLHIISHVTQNNVLDFLFYLKASDSFSISIACFKIYKKSSVKDVLWLMCASVVKLNCFYVVLVNNTRPLISFFSD